MRTYQDIHDLSGMERLRRELAIDPHHLKRARRAFYKNRSGPAGALAALPDRIRKSAGDIIEFHPLDLSDRQDSKIDGASKLVFRTHDDLLIETVILRVKSGRIALCISSQAGCAVGCTFCATGSAGLRRNLTTSEIVDQIVQADLLLVDEGRKVRNIVLMGMGEPFQNESAVLGALDLLEHPECFHHSLARVCVSTVGIPDSMVRTAQRFPRVRLALSLHSAREHVRASLIPLASRYSLEDLRRAVGRVNDIQTQPVMLEYLLLRGINDQSADLVALASWAADLDVRINLIPFNSIESAPGIRGTPQSQRSAFAQGLKAKGFTVTLRHSLGADIAAACGQLVRNAPRVVSESGF